MLQKIGFLPGFNKQVTATTAEGQWIAGDNVRFRYSTPEKIGGWAELGESYLTGPARALHHFVDNTGIKYAAIGTNRILYVYSGGIFYDIHPIKTTTTLTNAFTTTKQTPYRTLCSQRFKLPMGLKDWHKSWNYQRCRLRHLISWHDADRNSVS